MTELTKTELTKTELAKTELTKTELTDPAELEVGRPLVLTEATLLPVAFREPLRPQRTRHRFSRRLAVTSGHCGCADHGRGHLRTVLLDRRPFPAID